MQVLYIEDSSLDRMAFERVIRKSCLPVHYTCAETLHEGMSCIHSGNFDVIFADLKLPDGSAFDLLKEIGHSDSVIIILTGVSDIKIAVQAMKGGAFDYIVKDVSRDYLTTLPDYLGTIIRNRVVRTQEKLTDGMSLQAPDSLSVLAGGIAHEMNNVLTCILGDISLARLLIPLDVTLQNPWFDRTERAILHGKDIACRLLTYSDGGDPIVKRVDLRDLIQEALSLHHQRVNDVVIHIPENLPPLLVDPDLMRTALRAVIMNAMDASGFRPVYIQARQNPGSGNDSAGSYVCIDVRDEGSGIGPSDKTCIFNAFFTTKEGHLGLGLSSAKSIVERHQGQIEIMSSTGEGTVIRLSLPLAAPSILSTQLFCNKADQRGSTGTRVLVLDDEPGIREILQLTLEKEGFHVDVFSDGVDAVRAISDAYDDLNPYRLAILDLVIPGGMGGKEAVLEITKKSPSTLTIVSSGYSDDNISSRYLDFGFHASLPKPYRPKEMTDLLFSLLEEYYKKKNPE